jgi:transposase
MQTGVGSEGSKLADMAYITGEAREQVTMFPATLDELIPEDHVCRVIEAFVGRLAMGGLGFVSREPAETGRPGYDPRDVLKLYLYGYMNRLRSSRRLEAECQRNVEVMWLGGLRSDYKSIAEFRRARRCGGNRCSQSGDRWRTRARRRCAGRVRCGRAAPQRHDG